MSAVLTLVVPCYNEAQRLPLDDFARFLEAHPRVRICFVDDGSRDGTRGMLETFCARFPTSTELVVLPENKGKAEAVRAGMMKSGGSILLPCGDKNTSQFTGFWDADLATPLETSLCFLDVLEKEEQISCVIGSRSPRLGAKVERKPLRHFVGNAVAFVIRRYLGIPIYDTQCGAKIFRRDEAAKLFTEPFVSRWLFDVEIFKRMTNSSRVREVPLSEWRDVEGSKLKFYHGAKIMLELARIALHYRSEKKVAATACSCDNIPSP